MATSSPLMRSSTPAVRTDAKPKPQAAAARVLPLPCLLPALASGALLWMCYHPVSWGWLGWVALVPLFCLVRSNGRPRNIYFAAWAGGSLFFGPVLQWMRVADYRMYATWAMLAFYCSLYFPAAIWLTRVLERRTRLPLVITLPAVWVGLEYFRAFFATGFPWYMLAHTQHEWLTIIQVTDLGGTFAVSLLVVAVNALVFDLLYQFADLRRFFQLAEPRINPHTIGDDWPGFAEFFFGSWRRGLLVDGLALVVLMIAAWYYGEWRLKQDTMEPGPNVALLQGNIDQRIRNLAAHNNQARESMQQHYSEVCMRVLEDNGLRAQVELLIWPETSFPLAWCEVSREWQPAPAQAKEFAFWRDLEVSSREGITTWVTTTGKAQLLGMGAVTVDAKGKAHNYNTALLTDGNGSKEARYDKMHRVPFGEYVPLRDWLPFMNWFAPYDYDYGIGQGETFTRFTFGKHRFGVLVCFEDSDPFLARHYANKEDDGPPVDFLVNISNDGWFDGTSEHEAHLAVSRFRAIECRRAMVRAVNMGISAVIDSNGRVLKPDEPMPDEKKPKLWTIPFGGSRAESLPDSAWASYKHVSGVLVACVPIDNRFSLYAFTGDVLASLCWVLVGIGTVGMWLYARVTATREASALH